MPPTPFYFPTRAWRAAKGVLAYAAFPCGFCAPSLNGERTIRCPLCGKRLATIAHAEPGLNEITLPCARCRAQLVYRYRLTVAKPSALGLMVPSEDEPTRFRCGFCLSTMTVTLPGAKAEASA